ncbi:MAG: HNH endonuclease signature motif containing protein, partial [Gammaproteobacteria bacterium]|nr:HNH endonuclease signature motif containing protein [Gammaproteobacteria bacterium]
GRKRRTLPVALKRALWSRDEGCSFPGCAHKRYVAGHHIEHWADGGETSLENTMLLCSRHHRLVHEGGYVIRKDCQGRWYFRRPDGRAVPAYGYQPEDMVDEGVDEVAEGTRMGVNDASADASRCSYGYRVGSPRTTGIREAGTLYLVA